MKPLDLLKAYKQDIGKHRQGRISMQQLEALKLEGKENEILVHLLPYVIQAANVFKSLIQLSDLDYLDVLQEANIAALQAVRRWEPARGAAITSMIRYAVKGRLTRLAAKFGDVVPLSIEGLQDLQYNDYQPTSKLLQEILTDSSGDPEYIYRYLQSDK